MIKPIQVSDLQIGMKMFMSEYPNYAVVQLIEQGPKNYIISYTFNFKTRKICFGLRDLVVIHKEGGEVCAA
jgi:hypothetical protein